MNLSSAIADITLADISTSVRLAAAKRKHNVFVSLTCLVDYYLRFVAKLLLNRKVKVSEAFSSVSVTLWTKTNLLTAFQNVQLQDSIRLNVSETNVLHGNENFFYFDLPLIGLFLWDEKKLMTVWNFPLVLLFFAEKKQQQQPQQHLIHRMFVFVYLARHISLRISWKYILQSVFTSRFNTSLVRRCWPFSKPNCGWRPEQIITEVRNSLTPGVSALRQKKNIQVKLFCAAEHDEINILKLTI